MSLFVNNSSGSQNPLYVNGTPVARGQSLQSTSGGDFVSLSANSAASLTCDSPTGPLAVQLSTGSTPSPTNIQTNSYYTQSMYQVYYNKSYRWQVNTTGGSIGIRI